MCLSIRCLCFFSAVIIRNVLPTAQYEVLAAGPCDDLGIHKLQRTLGTSRSEGSIILIRPPLHRIETLESLLKIIIQANLEGYL